jgi:protein-S-isoprenylcysteine O-methyltransferase Ste14
LFTLYFYIGSVSAAQRLVAEFGQAYETYRQQVPRLFPVPGRRYAPPDQPQ